jgi:hypothetical protein
MPQKAGSLVGIASAWSEFQRIARTMLIAAGLAPETLLVRDASKAGWKRGLDATVGVVCDSVTAARLPANVHPMPFTLLAAECVGRLKGVEEKIAAKAG